MPGHWEKYYRGGSLVSCPTGREPVYTKEVREAWSEFFAALGDGARILDIGTGNGAVALIAKETAAARQGSFDIHGVDRAHIDPFRWVPGAEKLLGGIEFHAGVDAEALPFDDRTFDAVCGQYIVEYTDAPACLAEVYRVLCPGGRCQFIVHHEESVIVGNARESLRQADLVFAKTGVLRKLRAYCERSRASPVRASRARRDLLAIGGELERAAQASSNPLFLNFVIQAAGALIANHGRLSAGRMIREMGRLERDLKQWVQRLEDLTGAAPTQAEFDALLAAAGELGFRERTTERQLHDGNLVGWRVRMGRLA